MESTTRQYFKNTGTFNASAYHGRNYMEFKEMVRDEKYGITAQFWLSLYPAGLDGKATFDAYCTPREQPRLKNFLLNFFLPLYFSLQFY